MLICEWEQNVEKSQQVSLAIVEEDRIALIQHSNLWCDFYHRAAKPRIFHCFKSLKENALTTPDYALQIMSQKKFCTFLDFLNGTGLG